MSVRWRQVTPNCWVGDLVEGGPTISVYRNRSWRKNLATNPRPFRIEVFGRHFFDERHEHAGLAEARHDAEAVAQRMIGDLTAWSSDHAGSAPKPARESNTVPDDDRRPS